MSQIVAWGTLPVAVLLNGGVFAASSERAIKLTTYLRDGPGIRYRAVDEAQQGTLLSVVGCADGWCQVLDGGVIGYVAQSTLGIAAGKPAPDKSPSCSVDSQASYHGSRAVRYCRAGNLKIGRPAASNP